MLRSGGVAALGLHCPAVEIAGRLAGELTGMVELDQIAKVDVLIPGEFELLAHGCDCEVTRGADGVVGSIPVGSMLKVIAVSFVHDFPFRVPNS